MSLLKLILGPSGSGKTTAVFEDMIKRSEENMHKNYIVIVPEQFSHAVTQKIISMHPRHGIMNIDVLSFARLAHRIFDSAGGDTAEILDDTGKNLILTRLAAEHEKELDVLGGSIRRQGYISEIKSVISEFIQYEITPEEVDEMCKGDAGHQYLSGKLKDIGVLYRAFRDRMGDEFITKEELLDQAELVMDKAGFLKGASIILDSFTGFTPIQYRFLQSLMNHISDCTVCLPYDGKDGAFFSLSVKTIANLRMMAEKAGWEVEGGRENDSFYSRHVRWDDSHKDLVFLEENLFRKRGKNPPKMTHDGADSSIQIVEADIPSTEAAFAAAEARRLVQEEGYRYREIGIVMSDVNRYGRFLTNEAARYGVPCFIDTTNELLLNPFTEFIRSAIEIETEKYSYESVFHFLRTGLSDFDSEDVDLFENYVRAMNIRGRKKYRQRFAIHTRSMKEEELERINSVRERFTAILEPLDAVMTKRKVTVKEYTDALRAFIESENVPEKMEKMALRFEEEGRQEAADQYRQIDGKLSELFDRMENLIPDEVMPLSDYLDVLNAGFDEIRIGVIPPGTDTVTAGDMTRSRFSGIRALFFLGLNDDVIPAQNSGSGILSDMDREYLKERQYELSPTAREKVGLQKLYFYLCVTKPSEKLYLTLSERNIEGKGMRPSWFLNTVQRMFPDVNKRAISDADIREQFFAPEDALEVLSQSLQKDPDEKTMELYRSSAVIEDSRGKLDMMLDAAYRSHSADKISETVAKALYGKSFGASPSRLERFAVCACEHFMQYGLRLREREDFGFERRDLGTILHGVLQLVSEVLSEQKKTFADLSAEEAETITSEALHRFLTENENVVLMSSERNRYFVTRMERILLTTVKNLGAQAKAGSFRASAFEKDFSLDGFYGRIDRIDTTEEGHTVYLSVIDYKSGNKEFDLSRIYYGLDLQLVIYMNGAMEIERIEHPDKEVRPAGVFYYHIDDPVIPVSSVTTGEEEEIQTQIRKKLRLRGIVNSDPQVARLFDKDLSGGSSLVIPVSVKKDGNFDSRSAVVSDENFKVVSDHVRRMSEYFRREIAGGNVDPAPAEYDKQRECEWCSFRDCCGFDKDVPGYNVRKLPKISSTDDILDLMREGLQGEK